MLEIKFSCPHCGQHIRCDQSWFGRTATCPSCQREFTAPRAPASAPGRGLGLANPSAATRTLPRANAPPDSHGPPDRTGTRSRLIVGYALIALGLLAAALLVLWLVKARSAEVPSSPAIVAGAFVAEH